MRIAYLTAGAAGMYCGSCMHDNALARALIERGHECLLLPVYTPIRTDESSVSADQVFFGGINVYLQQKFPILGRLPRAMLRMLDTPWLIKMATRRVGATDPGLLGNLTISMLQGTEGHQSSEVKRLVKWLADEFKPDAIVLTNLLIGGCIPAIRQALDVKIFVWLQGDDIFLDHLKPAHRATATGLMQNIAHKIDGCLVNSRFYGNKMGHLLDIPNEKRNVLPLAIHTQPFEQEGEAIPGRTPGPLRIGYFARLAPEKGFHNLVEAFIQLSRRMGRGEVQLHYAGWLGEQHHEYLRKLQDKIANAGLEEHCHHHGSPDLSGKVQFLRSLDIFSVPTVYEEPKGLFVLESLVSRVPVVQPNHGAFPELLDSTRGGLLFEPGSTDSLCTSLEQLIVDHQLRQSMGMDGTSGVRKNHTIERQAELLEELLKK